MRLRIPICVAVAITSLTLGCTGRKSSVGGAVAIPAPGAVPAKYHIVYRVTSPGVRVHTEQLWVNRPFESRAESRNGAPPGGAVLSVVVASLGRQLFTASGGATPGVLQVPVTAAPFDVRLDGIAADALKSGVLVARETMTVAGRQCRVYRSASTLLSTSLTGAPRNSDYVDTCVDAAGLVMHEQTVSGGRQARERRAVEVQVGAQAAAGDYSTKGTRVPLDKGGGSIQALTLTSKPPGEPFWNLVTPPEGFTHVGRFAVVLPQPPVSATPAGLVGPSGAIDDVFVKGPDLIVVEQGPWNASVNATDVTISAVASSVFSRPGNGPVYVKVRGTVPPNMLEAVAKSLVSEPPGTLVTAGQ